MTKSTKFKTVVKLFSELMIVLFLSIVWKVESTTIKRNKQKQFPIPIDEIPIQQQQQNDAIRILQQVDNTNNNYNDESNRIYPANYFDELRTEIANNITLNTSIYEVQKHSILSPYNDSNGSSVQVVLQKGTNEVKFGLVDMKVFWPFTAITSTTSDKNNNRELLRQDDAVTILLAVYHWNNIHSTNVQYNPIRNAILALSNGDIKDCNIKMTVDLFDTKSDPIDTAQRFASVIKATKPKRKRSSVTGSTTTQRRQILQQKSSSTSTTDHTSHVNITDPNDIMNPPVSALIGSHRYDVSSLLAILTAVHHIPLFSSGAIGAEFDVIEQYPLFGRTIPSSTTDAKLAVQYFRTITESTHVAIIFVSDRYGSEVYNEFITQTLEYDTNFIVKSIAISPVVTEHDAKLLAQGLQSLQYKHIFMIVYQSQLANITKALDDVGLLGPDYLYVFHGFDTFSNLRQATNIPSNSTVAKAIKGAAIIQIHGSNVVHSITSKNGDTNDSKQPRRLASSGSNDIVTADELVEARKLMLADPDFVNYVRSKLPKSLENDLGTFDRDSYNDFDTNPGPLSNLLYDTITEYGLSMCLARNDTTEIHENSYYFTGEQIHDEFVKLSFTGTSGSVVMNPDTGRRDASTVTYVVYNSNIIGTDSNGNAIIEFIPSYQYKRDTWQVTPGTVFRYANGNETPPASLPPVDYKYNYIDQTNRAIGYTAMSITVFSSVASLVWLFYYRKHHIIQSAQPLFLVMVSIGTMIMALSIIPIPFDETIIKTLEGLNRACVSFSWLYFFGTNVACSALIAKIHGVYKAYRDPKVEFIDVTQWDILRIFLITFCLNCGLLLIWTIAFPPQWERIETGTTDPFGRYIESYGLCQGEHSKLFLWLIILLNVAYVMLGLYWAVLSRHIETEYHENVYIGVSLAAILQAWLMGLPILQAVQSNTSARFYVGMGIVFITSQSLVSLVFIPKMIALRRELRIVPNSRISMSAIRKADGLLTSAPLEEEENQPAGESNEEPKEARLPDVKGAVQEISTQEDVDKSLNNLRPIPEKRLLETKKVKSASNLEDKKSRLVATKDVKSMMALGVSTRFSDRKRSDRNRENYRGHRVLYNPRASGNLAKTGGYEVSKAQLQFLQKQLASATIPSTNDDTSVRLDKKQMDTVEEYVTIDSKRKFDIEESKEEEAFDNSTRNSAMEQVLSELDHVQSKCSDDFVVVDDILGEQNTSRQVTFEDDVEDQTNSVNEMNNKNDCTDSNGIDGVPDTVSQTGVVEDKAGDTISDDMSVKENEDSPH